MLFVVSLFAELIANDRPFLLSFKGELLFPGLRELSREKFGGFRAAADYRDPYRRS